MESESFPNWSEQATGFIKFQKPDLLQNSVILIIKIFQLVEGEKIAAREWKLLG